MPYHQVLSIGPFNITHKFYLFQEFLSDFTPGSLEIRSRNVKYLRVVNVH